MIEDKILGSRAGFGGIGGVGARQGVVAADTMEYKEGKGGFDPHARIPDMDLDGIDAAFLYPSLGLFAGAVTIPPSPPRCAAPTTAGSPITASPIPTACSASPCCRCSRSRLAIEEMRFARKELGFSGGFLRPNPYNDRKMHDPMYEPFWAAAEELDFASASTKAAPAACRRSASTASTGAARSTSSGTRWR